MMQTVEGKKQRIQEYLYSNRPKRSHRSKPPYESSKKKISPRTIDLFSPARYNSKKAVQKRHRFRRRQIKWKKRK